MPLFHPHVLQISSFPSFATQRPCICTIGAVFATKLLQAQVLLFTMVQQCLCTREAFVSDVITLIQSDTVFKLFTQLTFSININVRYVCTAYVSAE
jgi:hypothetical protein